MDVKTIIYTYKIKLSKKRKVLNMKEKIDNYKYEHELNEKGIEGICYLTKQGVLLKHDVLSRNRLSC